MKEKGTDRWHAATVGPETGPRTTRLLVHVRSSCTSNASEHAELLEDAVGVFLRGILTRQTKGVEGVLQSLAALCSWSRGWRMC